MNIETLNIQKIFALCQRYKVNRLFVFGFILTPRFRSDSDVDMLVDFSVKILTVQNI